MRQSKESVISLRTRKTPIPAAWLKVAATTALGIFLPTSAKSEGFRNPPAGAFNLGRAGGRIAHIDDSSAVAQNPANLIDLQNPEFQFTPSVVYIAVDYDGPAGQKAETKNPWKALPNTFATLPLADGKYAVGIGVTTPYGLSNEWETNRAFLDPTSLKYQAPHFAELKTINLNPTFAVRLCGPITFGLGLDVFWSELTFEQFYPWFLFPGSTLATPDGIAKAKGDGFGFGGNLGLTWQLTDRQRIAVTYRSPVTVCYDGTFKISNVTPTAAFLGASSRSDFETEIEFPTIVAAGYGINITDTIRLETDVEWIQFSNFDSLDLDVGNNAFLFPSTRFRQDWDDTFTAGIGGDWRFSPNWVVRAGYQFYESPVPDRTFSPTIPDANQHVFTVGLAYNYKKHAVEIAYGADFYDERKIDNNQNPALNGTYQNTVHLFSFAYRFTF